MQQVSIKGVSIMYCYAKEDAAGLYELERSMRTLQCLGNVTCKQQVMPTLGKASELERADILILLISPAFIKSNCGYDLKCALKVVSACEQPEVIPVIIAPLNPQETASSCLQAWQPINVWGNQDQGYYNVARAITQVVRAQLARQWEEEGRYQVLLERYEEALQAYNEALHLKRGAVDLYKERGHILLKLKRFNEALDTYNEAIRLKPDDEYCYMYKGDTFLHLQRSAEALVAYDYAVRINPDNADLYVRKGYALLDLQHYQDALRAFVRALQVDATHEMASMGEEQAVWRMTSEAWQACG